MRTRPPDWYELSGYGHHDIDLKTALEYRGRARAVNLRFGKSSPADVKKLARVMRLDLGDGPLPSWIDQLEHLRVLKWGGCPKKLPEKLVAIPTLRELYIEDAPLVDISALAKAGPNLETICIWRTPLSEDEAGLAAQIAELPGWQAGGFLKRKPSIVAPKEKDAVVAAMLSNTLADGADLSGRDLTGIVIEDAVLALTKMAGADLSNAIFRRCDFAHTELDGAKLRGTRFEDCFIDWRHRPAKNVDATGAVFTGGSLGLQWSNCTIAGARFENLAPGPSLTFEACDARGMHLEVITNFESSVDVDLSKSDLRGATVRMDLAADRREALEKKPNPRLKWKPMVTKGVKTDETTVLEQVALPAKKSAAKKPAAKSTEKSAAKKPAAKKPAAKKPAAKKPARRR
jgi:hypothetical protein